MLTDSAARNRGGSADRTVRRWEASSDSLSRGRLLATLEGHTSSVEGVALSVEARMMASGGADGSVRLWDVPSGRPLANLAAHTGPVSCVALSAEGLLWASGSEDGKVRVWSLAQIGFVKQACSECKMCLVNGCWLRWKAMLAWSGAWR
jgi:WD40 repeat protein